MVGFDAERNADSQTFADKLAQYKKCLDEVNQQGYANKWNVNPIAAGQRTQNQLMRPSDGNMRRTSWRDG